LAEQPVQSFDRTLPLQQLLLPLQQLLVSGNPFLVFGHQSVCSASRSNLFRSGSVGANMSRSMP
jgi:hypothetical protein